MNELKPGDIVQELDPNEHVEVRRVTPFGNKMLVEGIGVQSRREIRRLLSLDELARLVKVRGSEYTYDGDAQAFLLGAESHRIRIAYQFDPLFAVNSSVVDVLPHQIEAIYRYLLPLPRIRFLLADDTGAGKTIMAGLLIKELLFRGAISKILIITPGGLTGQWQDEMLDKFALSFRVINRASFEAEPAQFARAEDGFFITSIDFIARHEGCLNAAKETQWDIIVVDEAHKLSAFEYGTKVERTERYKAVEALAERTDHLLFLTATPHRGRRDTFRRLLLLLDQDLFQKDEHVTQHVRHAATTSDESFEDEQRLSNARSRFFLRRLKEEMVSWDNQALFKPRHTKTTGYELTPEELELYNAVTKYVRSRRKEAKEKRNRNVELTLLVMQRRLASSIYAITRTLENRRVKIDEVLKILHDPAVTAAEKRKWLRGDANDIPSDIAEYEELDENQRQSVDERIFRQVLSDDPLEVAKERDEVEKLLQMAKALRNHNEAKFAELLKVLDSSDVIRADDEKLVIFTEHKDTLNNLAERLEKRGYTVVTIHGGMDVDKRKQAQREFHDRAKILVATDAAGEGINLQFCRYLINWDIPWNPNRLEQRMGRIHRYGQSHDVWVFNLVASNTREGAVLQRILAKLDVMRDQMGTDRVYDVIDEWLEEVPLVQLIEQSIDSEDPTAAVRRTDERLAAVERQNKAAELIALQKKQSLASKLDLRAARELRDQSDERRLQPCFIQRFFTRAYQTAGGMIQDDPYFPVFRLVGRVPEEILDIARQARLSISDRYEMPFVFDKNLLSVASPIKVPEETRLLGPAHPLFEAVCEWAIRRARDSFAKGVMIVDPNIVKPQRLWVVRSSVCDERREERKRLAHEQLSTVIADDLGLRDTSSAYLLNCTPLEEPLQMPALPDKSRDEVQMWAYEQITESQLRRVRQTRQEECDVRRRYLNDTFTELIMGLQNKLNDLQQAQLFGDDDPEERNRLEEHILKLKERKQMRLDELALMMRLSAELPQVLTSALVVPAPVAYVEGESQTHAQGFPMRRDDEVERIAMEITKRYERSRGWTPHDVSRDGEHYDIRSESSTGEKRFIEVKGRAVSGPIVLTAPEVDRLRQLADRAFMYIVTSCKSERPHLRIIQNPMASLSPEMLYRQVQYLVDESDWSKRGEEVNELPTLD